MSKAIEVGVLPTLEDLKQSYSLLLDEINPVIENLNTEDTHNIKEKLQRISKIIKDLPEKVNHSYQLLQLVIKSINSSRQELKKSVDGLLKKTGAQLRKVTTTTEDATNKILDVAEKLDDEQFNILDLLDRLKQEHLADSDTPIIDEIREKIQENQNKAFMIIDFLQFQDITAQQISGAYSLLADVEKTLLFVSNLLRSIDDNYDSDVVIEHTSIDKRSFNENAVFSDKKDIQDAIDRLFESGSVDVDIPEDKIEEEKLVKFATTKEKADDIDIDIDALFENKDKVLKNEEVDIDSLFENKDKILKEDEKKSEDKNKEKASQDDIDKLFG